ncbi:MAG: undecaprenyl-diphosphate phosphatase [Candidatus Aceula meridiana]|nr:undecaprenyl-diphosphate phosphatase [Candidatus Aceula meridiana]
MIEAVITGIIQGITEWLPVSSEGVLALVKTNFFGSEDVSGLFRQILFLHLGTFFAALVYLRSDVKAILKTLFRYKSSSEKNQKILIFLLVSTLISGVLGIILLKFFIFTYSNMESPAEILTLLVGILLVITAFLQLRSKEKGLRDAKDLNLKDAIVLGIAQGFSALPGLSRSGLTVSFLLLKKFDKAVALRLSFLMSLPIVLAGNILLNFRNLDTLGLEDLVAFMFAFLAGILTIHGLFKLAEKINFGYFVLFFAAVVIFSRFL